MSPPYSPAGLVQAQGEQAVIAGELVEVVAAPVVAVVLAGADGRNVLDADEAEGGSVFERDGERVAVLEQGQSWNPS